MFFLAGEFLKFCWKSKSLNVSPESAEQKLFCQKLKIMLYNYVLLLTQMNANKLRH